jgi:glutamine amidotransferase-like uncharacterized protein
MENRIGIYNGPGVGYEHTIIGLWSKLSKDISIEPIDHKDFKKKVLQDYKVIILPGGSGSGICRGLGSSGKQALVSWVSNGGTLIGVCAGMYAMTKGYEWSMGLIDYYVTDSPHWERGNHQTEIHINVHGRSFLKLKRRELIVNYHNGPIVAKIDDKDLNITNEQVLATFKTECHNAEGYDNLMIGSPAIVKANYGKGTVIGFSPHLEKDRNHKKIIAKMIKSFING